MKVAVVGANGRLGRKLVQEATCRHIEVLSIVKEGQGGPDVLSKSLFDLSIEDLRGIDCLLSAFGSGFDADPVINKLALEKLGDLARDLCVPLVAIGGAGLLYPDSSHVRHVFEGKDHPSFLKGISKNLLLGLESLRKMEGVTFTLVCPSLYFDYEGAKTGRYRIGTKQEVLYSSKGDSRVSYADLAMAMVDIAEKGGYPNQCITVCEE